MSTQGSLPWMSPSSAINFTHPSRRYGAQLIEMNDGSTSTSYYPENVGKLIPDNSTQCSTQKNLISSAASNKLKDCFEVTSKYMMGSHTINRPLGSKHDNINNEKDSYDNCNHNNSNFHNNNNMILYNSINNNNNINGYLSNQMNTIITNKIDINNSSNNNNNNNNNYEHDGINNHNVNDVDNDLNDLSNNCYYPNNKKLNDIDINHHHYGNNCIVDQSLSRVQVLPIDVTDRQYNDVNHGEM